MATILNFEAAQRERDPRYMAMLGLVRSCEALRDLALTESSLADLYAARDAIGRAIEGVAATG